MLSPELTGKKKGVAESAPGRTGMLPKAAPDCDGKACESSGKKGKDVERTDRNGGAGHPKEGGRYLRS